MIRLDVCGCWRCVSVVSRRMQTRLSEQAAAEERHKAMQLLEQVKATVEDAMACGR